MFKPLGKRVLIAKPIPPTEVKSQAGILLAPSEAKPENIAEVLAIGGKVEEVKVGDRVVFPTYGATEISEDDTTYLMFAEDDLLAVHTEVVTVHPPKGSR